MALYTVALLLSWTLFATAALAHEVPRVRVEGATLQQVEQTLFDPQTGLAQGNAPFEARFEGLALAQNDQQKLLEDIRTLTQNIPDGSRVRLEGQIEGRQFNAEVRNHNARLEVKLRGVQFGTREEAQTFVNSLPQANRARVRGLIDGQRFETRFRAEQGRVEQQFRVKEPKSGTVITTGSGRSFVTGGSGKREDSSGHGRMGLSSSGRDSRHGGHSAISSGSGRSGGGGGDLSGSSGRSGSSGSGGSGSGSSGRSGKD